MTYLIKEIATKLNITKDTLYYYEKSGLLPPIKRNAQGNRCYSEGDLAWIYLIRCLRDIDLPIQQIKQYTELLKDETSSLESRQAILIQFQRTIEKKIEKYHTINQLLTKKLSFYDEQKIIWEQQPDPDLCYNYQEDWAHFKSLIGAFDYD